MAKKTIEESTAPVATDELACSLEKFLQTTGIEINKYRRAYLISSTRGAQRTPAEWRNYLANA